MSEPLNFRDVCMYLKTGEVDSTFAESLDHLVGLGLIGTVIALGPAGAGLLSLLAVKNTLTGAAKYVIDKVNKAEREAGYLQRQKQLQAAYTLLVYSSFAHACGEVLPEIKLLSVGKSATAKSVPELVREIEATAGACGNGAHKTLPMAALPHPAAELEQMQEPVRLFHNLTKGLTSTIEQLAQKGGLDGRAWAKQKDALNLLQDRAAKRFKDEYFAACQKFPEFALWAGFHAHEETRTQVSILQEQSWRALQVTLESLEAQTSRIDLGFTELGKTLAALPALLRQEQNIYVRDTIRDKYVDAIKAQVAGEITDPDDPSAFLTFPTKQAAYVPQTFQVVLKRQNEMRLEDKGNWTGKVRPGLGAFIVRFLCSPQGTNSLLLILGDPGAGKSLLTEMLAAAFATTPITPLRVVLRDRKAADNSIQSLIEEQIREDAREEVSWGQFRRELGDEPPLIIFDGYDELLQVRGQIFRNFLNQVRTFQEAEARAGRHVRVIVTSRITLIDKAVVPLGTTVLRLAPFDEQQRNTWVEKWNAANAAFFSRDGSNIRPFRLPEMQKGRKNSRAVRILHLAEQPLLLLMLAIYDSFNNRITCGTGEINQAELYDDLLRKFILRQLRKEGPLDDKEERAKAADIQRDMLRLGVVAMGMFNRRQLHIQDTHLKADLKYFRMERNLSKEAEEGSMIQADLEIGSFFFVHKPKAQGEGAHADQSREERAYEFLHNTFGEFLAADFLFRQVVKEVKAVQTLLGDNPDELGNKLKDPGRLDNKWFASLMQVPLHSRPLVLDMLRESIPRIVGTNNLGEFLAALDHIVASQIEHAIIGRHWPAIMGGIDAPPYPGLPLIGHIATYTLNLIVLRTVLGGEGGYIFRDSQFGLPAAKSKDGDDSGDLASPWDRLTHLWRSWFSLDGLAGLPSILDMKRKDGEVRLTARSTFESSTANSGLERVFAVSEAIGDQVLASLAGLVVTNRIDPIAALSVLENVADRATSGKLGLGTEIVSNRIKQGLRLGDYRLIRNSIGSLLDVVRRHPAQDMAEITEIIISVLRKSNKPDIAARFAEELMSSIHPSLLEDLLRFQPRLLAEFLRTLRREGAYRHHPHLGRLLDFIGKRGWIPKEEMHPALQFEILFFHGIHNREQNFALSREITEKDLAALVKSESGDLIFEFLEELPPRMIEEAWHVSQSGNSPLSLSQARDWLAIATFVENAALVAEIRDLLMCRAQPRFEDAWDSRHVRNNRVSPKLFPDWG